MGGTGLVFRWGGVCKRMSKRDSSAKRDLLGKGWWWRRVLFLWFCGIVDGVSDLVKL